MTKVFIINSNSQYDRMFADRGFMLTANLKEADLVQFTGGEDVTPHLYGQSKHPATLCNPERDVYEMGLYHQALCLGKRMAGICRGGQFLHVMTGGSMYQHIDGHTTSHMLEDEDGRKHWVTSTHHQGMVPNESTFLTSTAVCEGVEVEIQEVGITGGSIGGDYQILMFQPHPEFRDGECQDLYFNLLNTELRIFA